MDNLDKFLNKVTLGDSYELIKEIPDKSIDLIIIDPPYEIEIEGGNTNIGKSLKQNMLKELDALKIINGMDYTILDEFMRIMKVPNIYIWCNKKQILSYLEYFVKQYNCVFEIICWCKPNSTPLCGGNYLIDKEYCLYFRKGVKLNTTFETAKTFYLQNKNIKDKKFYEHPTIKPLNIIKNLIVNSSNKNDIVLDCFSGSGTTCVAAKQLDRQFIGIEIDPKYYKIAIERLENCTIDTNSILKKNKLF